MSPKGRPTESKKDTRVYVRMDDETIAVLDKCKEQLDTTRSEVIRQGINLVNEKLEQKK